MIADPEKSLVKQKRGKRKIHPNSLANLTSRLKPGQTANPEGKPKIKTNANYWRNKYLTFSKEQLTKELKKKDLKAVQIACLRDVYEMMKEPRLADKAWDRLRETYDRDEPLKNDIPMPDIHITIVRE